MRLTKKSVVETNGSAGALNVAVVSERESAYAVWLLSTLRASSRTPQWMSADCGAMLSATDRSVLTSSALNGDPKSLGRNSTILLWKCGDDLARSAMQS